MIQRERRVSPSLCVRARAQCFELMFYFTSVFHVRSFFEILIFFIVVVVRVCFDCLFFLNCLTGAPVLEKFSGYDNLGDDDITASPSQSVEDPRSIKRRMSQLQRTQSVGMTIISGTYFGMYPTSNWVGLEVHAMALEEAQAVARTMDSKLHISPRGFSIITTHNKSTALRQELMSFSSMSQHDDYLVLLVEVKEKPYAVVFQATPEDVQRAFSVLVTFVEAEPQLMVCVDFEWFTSAQIDTLVLFDMKQQRT
eukprot:m.23341 g.23341  ORF g.23341 m.23341 type:complete len:253 (-) comp8486_c0_seq1:741-1499(-)